MARRSHLNCGAACGRSCRRRACVHQDEVTGSAGVSPASFGQVAQPFHMRGWQRGGAAMGGWNDNRLRMNRMESRTSGFPTRGTMSGPAILTWRITFRIFVASGVPRHHTGPRCGTDCIERTRRGEATMKRTAQTAIATLILGASIATGVTTLPAHAASRTVAITQPSAVAGTKNPTPAAWCYDPYWGWYMCSYSY